MNVRAYTQAWSGSPYAVQMVTEHLHVDVSRDGLRWTVSELAKRPAGHRVLLLQDPQRDARTIDNIALLRSVCDETGICPDRFVIDAEGEGMADPASPLRSLLRDRVMTPLRTHFDGVPFGNYATATCGDADGAAVPEINGHPGTMDATEYPEQSPCVAAWANGLLARDEAYLEPHALVGLQKSLIVATYREHERRKLPTPIFNVWTAPVTSGLLDLPRWHALMRMVPLLTGGRFNYFNGDCTGGELDRQLSAACADVEANTAGAEWVRPLGVSLRHAKNLQASTCGDIVTWAELSDGSVVGLYLWKSAAASRTKTANIPGTSIDVTFTRPDGVRFAWARR